MKFVQVLVEGQTEEAFIKSVFDPYLLSFDISITPVILATKRIKSGLKFKGGVSSYQKIRKDIMHLIGNTSAKVITTMFDYYGLPEDFPGKDTIPSGVCFDKVEYLEDTFASDINDRRFIPFLMLHEFETFAFVSPNIVNNVFPDLNIEQSLTRIKSGYTCPEEINDGPETHPSKRIERLAAEYRKNLHGPIITKRIGMDPILQECPHFNRWVERIKQA